MDESREQDSAHTGKSDHSPKEVEEGGGGGFLERVNRTNTSDSPALWSKIWRMVQELAFSIHDARTTNLNAQSKEWEKLERILLTVDSGTLAVSVTFLSNHLGGFIHQMILKLSWVALAVALISLLASYAFFDLMSHDMGNKLNAYTEETITNSVYKALRDPFFDAGIRVTNYLALGLSVVGMVLLAIFGFFTI